MRALEIMIRQHIILVFSLKQLHKIRQNMDTFNCLNAELNPICHFLALVVAHLILHISEVRINKNYVRDKNDKGRANDIPRMVNYVCC